MPLYSPQGVAGRLQVGPDGNLITGTLAPNVSPFGWTTQDMKSVQDIVKWVSVANDAATSAQGNADYVEKAITYVDTVKGEVDGKLADATTAVTNGTAYTTKAIADLTALLNEIKTEQATTKQLRDNTFQAMNWVKSAYDKLLVKFPDLDPYPALPVANPPLTNP